jgi:hypothetical protein
VTSEKRKRIEKERRRVKQEFREPPDLPRLFTALAHHGLRYVLFGSVGFMAYGLQTASGDLDICIDPDKQNLRRLSTLLLEVRAKPRSVPGWSEKEACERWQPEPLVVETFDHLFTTTFGDLDIVPFPYGPHGKEDRFTFASLHARAVTKTAFGQQIRVAHLDDVIASKLSARREKDLRLLSEIERLQQLQAQGQGSGWPLLE